MKTGSCCCGNITFELTGDIAGVNYCYCETCRKLSGAVSSVVGMVSSSDFRLTRGQNCLSVYESSPGKCRYYCNRCFSPIYVQLRSIPNQIRIRLGVLDYEPDVEISSHIWVSEKPYWYTILDDLPQFDAWPDR